MKNFVAFFAFLSCVFAQEISFLEPTAKSVWISPISDSFKIQVEDSVTELPEDTVVKFYKKNFYLGFFDSLVSSQPLQSPDEGVSLNEFLLTQKTLSNCISVENPTADGKFYFTISSPSLGKTFAKSEKFHVYNSGSLSKKNPVADIEFKRVGETLKLNLKLVDEVKKSRILIVLKDSENHIIAQQKYKITPEDKEQGVVSVEFDSVPVETVVFAEVFGRGWFWNTVFFRSIPSEVKPCAMCQKARCNTCSSCVKCQSTRCNNCKDKESCSECLKIKCPACASCLGCKDAKCSLHSGKQNCADCNKLQKQKRDKNAKCQGCTSCALCQAQQCKDCIGKECDACKALFCPECRKCQACQDQLCEDCVGRECAACEATLCPECTGLQINAATIFPSNALTEEQIAVDELESVESKVEEPTQDGIEVPETSACAQCTKAKCSSCAQCAKCTSLTCNSCKECVACKETLCGACKEKPRTPILCENCFKNGRCEECRKARCKNCPRVPFTPIPLPWKCKDCSTKVCENCKSCEECAKLRGQANCKDCDLAKCAACVNCKECAKLTCAECMEKDCENCKEAVCSEHEKELCQNCVEAKCAACKNPEDCKNCMLTKCKKHLAPCKKCATLKCDSCKDCADCKDARCKECVNSKRCSGCKDARCDNCPENGQCELHLQQTCKDCGKCKECEKVMCSGCVGKECDKCAQIMCKSCQNCKACQKEQCESCKLRREGCTDCEKTMCEAHDPMFSNAMAAFERPGRQLRKSSTVATVEEVAQVA